MGNENLDAPPDLPANSLGATVLYLPAEEDPFLDLIFSSVPRFTLTPLAIVILPAMISFASLPRGRGPWEKGVENKDEETSAYASFGVTLTNSKRILIEQSMIDFFLFSRLL